MEFYSLMALAALPSYSKADSAWRNNVDKPRIESSFNVFIYLYIGEYMCLYDWLWISFFYYYPPPPFSVLLLQSFAWHFQLYGNVRCLFFLSFSPIGQKWDYFIGSLDSVMGWRKRYFRTGSIKNACLDLIGIVRWSNTAVLTEKKVTSGRFYDPSNPQGGPKVSALLSTRR